MAERTCHNCVYCCHDPCLWLRLLWEGEPLLPRCANHPWWPGQLHDVPGVPCRHYRPRPSPPQGDNVRMIALTDGSYAYVDAADYDWLNQWTWHLEDGYAVRWDKHKKVLMHRMILPPPRGKVVDHIDGNKLNNYRPNLRVCTHSQNSRNCRKRGGSRSMYKGVYYHRARHKWGTKCSHRGKPIWLGLFDTEIEAARAYDRKAVELFGEFARLNFPREWPPERRAEVYAQRQKEQGRSRKSKGKSNKTRERRRGEGRTVKVPPSGSPRPRHRGTPDRQTAASERGSGGRAKRTPTRARTRGRVVRQPTPKSIRPAAEKPRRRGKGKEESSGRSARRKPG